MIRSGWFILAFVVTAQFVGNLHGQLPVHQQPVVTGVAAIVNSYVITRADIERLAANQLRDLRKNAQRMSVGEFNQEFTSIFNETVELLINRKLILSEFDRLKENSNGQLEFPEKLVDSEVKKIIDDRYNGNRLDFIRTLTEQGMTLHEFKREIREDLTVELMVNQHVSNEITVSPQRIVEYYNNNYSRFTSADRVKIRMIMIFKQTAGASGIMSEVKNKLLDGASFKEMAEVYSQGPRRDLGGDYGWISKNSSTLRQDLQDIAFSLNKGEVSGIIDKPEAFYVIYCEDRESAARAPLSEVRGDIEEILLEEERSRLRKKWVDKLKSKAYIKKLQTTGG